ncbi:MAG: hypothetical protein IPJ77_12515 [Planctomycetes bacterium]|nr:hypothetical protein [Planctomycetota bacterium]
MLPFLGWIAPLALVSTTWGAQLPAGGAQQGTPVAKESSTGAGAGNSTGGANRGGTQGDSSVPAPRPEDKLGPTDGKAPGVDSVVAKSPAPHVDPRPKDTPRTPTGDNDDRSGFETWWLFNRDALLDLHARAGLPARSGDGTDPVPNRPGGVRSADVAGRVLPALRRVVETETNPVLLAETLLAIARVADGPGAGADAALRARIAQELEAALAHPQAQVAESAALALGILGEGSSLRTLLELARDGRAGREACGRDSVPYRLRAFSAYAVGLVAHQTASEDVRRFGASGLVGLLGQRETPREVQVACVTGLGVAGLASDPKSWQKSVQRTSRELEPTASREALVAHLVGTVVNERANPVLRAQTLVAVARLARDAAEPVHDEIERLCVELLSPVARTPNELAQSAALGLGLLSDAGAAPQDREARARLMSAAHEGDLDTRHFAVIALGQSAARADEDPAAAFSGAPEVHRFLLRELAEGRGAARSYAALALGLYGRGLRDAGRAPSNEAGVALLERLQKATMPDEVAACALALGLRRDQAAVPVLRARFVQASDDSVRASTAVALGLIGAAEAKADLWKELRAARGRPAFLREASIALALLGDAELVPGLCAELASAPGSAAELATLQALALVGDARALDPLLARVADANASADVRARAVASLAAICDGRRLPWNDAFVRGANYLATVETLSDARGQGLLDRR